MMNFLRNSSVLLLRGRCIQDEVLITSVRNLSASETATALRPFYFAVHPDLFGKYPKERETNEGSLKLLNEYLNNLHSQQKVRPVSLVFNVRHTASNSSKSNDVSKVSSLEHSVNPSEPFRTIRISLLSESVRSTVSTILKSCNLPLDYVNSIKSVPQAQKPPLKKPIVWEEYFYGFYPEAATKKKKSFETLSSWLDRNISKARKNQAAKEGIKIETSRLKQQIADECGLVDIKWASGWGLTQFRASLKGFLRVYQENKDFIDLKGKVLIFGNENGVCLQENIMVKSDDLADSWIPFLKSLKSHNTVLKNIPAYENVLSHLLNNANITARRNGYPIILAKEYAEQLHTLSRSLEKFFTEENCRVTAGTLKNVDVVVECAQGPLHLNPAGQVLIPSSCPAFLIIDYLNDNAETAIQMKAEYEKKERIVSKLVANCKETLQLQSLTKDANITCDQLESFCRKILDGDPRNIPISLMGCSVKVAQFYSVMSDGEIYLPWNWKGEYD